METYSIIFKDFLCALTEADEVEEIEEDEK